MTIQYDPQKVTDWLTPLEKVYARQSQQLDRYHQQLRERDRQEEAATINLPEIASKLASFSQTIGQVVEARETGQRKKVTSELEGLYTHPEDPDHVRKYFEYYNSKKNILKTDTEYLARLNKIKNKDLRNYLLNASAKKHIYAKEFFFSEAVKVLPQKFKEYQEGLSLDERQDYQINTRPYAEKNRNYLRRFSNDYLAVFKPSNGVVSGILNQGVNRWLDTESTTAKLKANQIIHGEQELQIDRDIPTQAGLGKINAGQYSLDWINERAKMVYGVDNPDGVALAKEDYKTHIVRLRRSNTLSSDQLDNILEAELVDYSGGKTGKDIFTKAQYNEIVAADQEATSAEFGLYKTTEKVKQQETLLDIEKNPENWTQAALDQEILRLENSTYADPTLLKELKEVDLLGNDPDIAAQESEDWTVLDDNGTLLTKDNIAAAKLIKNTTINRQITKRQEDLKLSYRKNKMDNYETRNIQHGRNIIKKSGKGTLGDQEYDLGGWPGMLQNELTSLEAIIYKDLYDRNPSDTTIKGQVIEEIEKIKTRNGWYAKAGDPDEGIWTFDENGDLTNLKNSIKAKNLRLADWDLVEADEFTNKNKITAWDNSIINAEKTAVTVYSPGQTFAQKLINTPNLLEEDDIIAPIQFGWEEIGKGNQFKITSKTAYIASRIPNVTRVELWKAQANVLINSDNPKHKELVKIYNLKKAVEEVQDPQRTLIEFAQQTGDKYLENVIQKNPEQVSPKQWTRFLSNLPLDYAEEERYLTLKADYPELRDLTNEKIDQILENINKNKKEKELQPN